MKVNLKKIIYDDLLLKELKFFKQFNIYKNINCEDYIYSKRYFRNRCNLVKKILKICKVESTNPIISIDFVKIIDTIEGTSIEGQHLTGKKLIVIGKIKFSLICCYSYYDEHKYKYKHKVKNISLPFSTFIIIPKDICNREVVNLRYIIEDISIVYLEDDRIMVSITPFIQYVDQYLIDNIP